MDNSFDGHHSSKPAVQKVESVKRNVEHLDQRIVSTCQDYQWDHVDHCQRPRPVPQVAQHGCFGPMPLDAYAAQGNVHGDNGREDKALETSGEDSDTPAACNLHLLVMARPEQRGVEQMLLDAGKGKGGRGEVELLFVVEASEGPNITHAVYRQSVDCHKSDHRGEDD